MRASIDVELYIKHVGILFGSRLWGGAKYNSDYDYAMTTGQFRIIKPEVRRLSGYKSLGDKYDGSNILFNVGNHKFLLNEKLYNVVTYEDDLIGNIPEINSYVYQLVGTKLYSMMRDNKDVRNMVIEAMFKEVFASNITVEEVSSASLKKDLEWLF